MAATMIIAFTMGLKIAAPVIRSELIVRMKPATMIAKTMKRNTTTRAVIFASSVGRQFSMLGFCRRRRRVGLPLRVDHLLCLLLDLRLMLGLFLRRALAKCLFRHAGDRFVCFLGVEPRFFFEFETLALFGVTFRLGRPAAREYAGQRDVKNEKEGFSFHWGDFA